jgi:hypothetical protein
MVPGDRQGLPVDSIDRGNHLMCASFFPALSVLTLVVVAFVAPAVYAVTWDEGVNGELSGDPNAPTSLGSFGVGTHSVTATSSGGEQDNYTFTIGAGLSLTQVINFSYNSPLGDDTAFIGLASGATIPNQGAAPGNLLGYAHIGPNYSTVGTNVLDDIAGGPGAIGFSPPLGAGPYSIWSQQVGSASTFRMDFVVVPEPASVALVVIGAFCCVNKRRSRSRAGRACE